MVINLKVKLINIYEKYIKDYVIEIKKYYFKVKKKIKKIYKNLLKLWKNPQSNLGKKIKKLSQTKLAKITFGIIGIFLILNILISIIKPSFAIYKNESQFTIINGIVGNNQYDYMMLIYIEKPTDSNTNNKKYSLSDSIPVYGYAYSGYSCKNNSTLFFDENTKNTRVNLIKKDICSIYFDYLTTPDISLIIMLEETVNSNTYTIANSIPYYGYKYSYYECDNNSNLTYDSEYHKINVETNNKETCKVYFKKEPADIEVKLYLEDTINSNRYTEKKTIPTGKIYSLNDTRSECLNNNERTETEISYIDGYIEILSKEVTYCKVYLELENE